jgi:large repetitive protein
MISKLKIRFIALAFALLAGLSLLTGFSTVAMAQSTSQVTIVGIPPVLPSPFAVDIENSFVTGQYQIIFNYTSFNPAPADFIFDFTVLKGGQEIIAISSLPSPFTPGTYIFTSFFEELIFPQGANDVFQQLDGDIRNQIIQTGTVPEGSYSIRINARAANQPNIVSIAGIAHFLVQYPSPPIPVSPANGSNVLMDVPIFAWTPVVNTAGILMEYEFLLVEVIPGQSHLQAINSNQEIALVTLVGNTTLIYTPDFLPLEENTEYAWQITARDATGNVPLQNQGKTEIYTFTYKAAEDEGDLIADFSVVEEITLIPQFAALSGIAELTVTEYPVYYQLDGLATLSLEFDGMMGPLQGTVMVNNLMVQKGSLENPVILGGSVNGSADQIPFILPSDNPWIEFQELFWSFGQNFSVTAAIQTPGEQWFDATGELTLTRQGLSGSVEISGAPLVQYSRDFMELELYSLGVSYPENRVWGNGNAKITGQDTPCDLDNFEIGDTQITIGLLCSQTFQIPLVNQSDLLLMEVDRVLGILSLDTETDEFGYDVELRSHLGFKTVNNQYCGTRARVNIHSEEGLSVTGSQNYCPEFNPKIDLGFAKLQFENTELTELSYNSDTEEWNFEVGLDAILEVDAFDSWTSLTMTDITVNRQGIQFSDVDFHDDSYIRPLPVFNAQLFELSLSTFSLNAFTFPLFDWDELAPGPWDIAFEGSAVVQNGFGAPMCLLGTTLDLTNGRIDQSRVIGNLSLGNFNGCEWTIGEGITIQMDAISGTAGVNYPDFDEIEPFGRLNLAGSVTVGQPFTCDGLEPIAFEDGQFVISDGLEGTLENVIPGCPLDVGPFQAEVTQSNIVFSVDEDEGQQAIMNSEATLTMPDGLDVDGIVAIDLMNGTIKTASFIIDEPFDWHIPSAENPVLSFRINYAEVTGNGLSVEGRHELIMPESNMGVTFQDFLFDLETLAIEDGSIIFDDAFAFEAGITDDLSGFDFSVVPVGSELTLDTGILMELTGTIIIDSQGLRLIGSAGIADAQVSFNGVDYNSAVTVEFTDDFRMSLYPFGVASGQANFFYEGNQFAFADPSGFHPVWAFFADVLIPERLPLPTEDIAYIQLRNDEDELMVYVTENEDGNLVISSLPGQPLTLVIPYLNPANPPVLANISLNDLTITPNPFNPEVVSGTITAAIPEDDPQFDLSHLNIPLVPKAIEYGTRLVNNVQTTALWFLGDLVLFDQQLADEAEVAFYIRGDGYVRADFEVYGMNTQLAMTPGGEITMGVTGVRGTFEMMLNPGSPSYDIHVDGNLQINTEQGLQAGANLTIRTQTGGYTAITEFDAYTFADLPKINIGNRFRFGLEQIVSIENFSYETGEGFVFAILFDMILHIGLADGGELDFPVREIEIRNDGIRISPQNISESSIPGLNLPEIELAGFDLKPLALRTPDLEWNWGETPAIGQSVSMDFSVDLPELEGISQSLPDGFLFTNVGLDDGYLTGSVEPVGFLSPVEIPVDPTPGINSPTLLIDEIAGALSKLEIEGGFRQAVDFSINGRLGDLPAFTVSDPNLCSDAEFSLNIIEGRAFEGSIMGMQPCGTLELGPVTLEMTTADLNLYLDEDEQKAELAGGVEISLPVPQGVQPLVVSGELTLDIITGKISDGSVSINQPFALNMPMPEMENPLFSLGVNMAELSAEGLKLTGTGTLNHDPVNVEVSYEELIFELPAFEIVGGSATIAADVAVDFTVNPFGFAFAATGSAMPAGNTLRMNLDAAATLDQNGLTFNGSSNAILQFNGEQYSNLRVVLADDFAMSLNGLAITRGRAEFYWDQDGQPPAEEYIAMIDENGFHFGAGLIAFLPDRIPLPTEEIAYIDIKDEQGNPLISVESIDGGGYTITTNENQPLQLVIPALQHNESDLEVDILFSLITDGAYNVTGGTLALQSELNLQQRLNLPVSLTELSLDSENGLKLKAGLRFDLPAIFSGIEENDELDAVVHVTLSPSGIESGSFMLEASPIYAFSALGEGELTGDTFTASLTKIEASFGDLNSVGIEGSLSSSLIMEEGDAPIGFDASWADGVWSFGIEEYDPGELTLGSATFRLNQENPLTFHADDDSLYVAVNGQVSFEDLLGEAIEVTVQELKVGVTNYQNSPSLLFSVGTITGDLGTQQFDLFEGALVMELSDISVSLTGRSLVLTSDGELTFLEQTIGFEDFSLSTSAPHISIGDISIENPIQIISEYLVLTEFSFDFDDGIRVDAELTVSLPQPADIEDIVGNLSIYRNDDGVQVETDGLQIDFNDKSTALGDFGVFHLTALHVGIDPMNWQNSSIGANGHITIPTEDNPVIYFGQAENVAEQPGLSIALNGDVTFDLSGNVNFDYEMSFFTIAVEAEMAASNGGFEIELSGSAEVNIPGVEASDGENGTGGGIEFEEIRVNQTGIINRGRITGGSISVAGVASLQIGEFIYQTDTEIQLADTGEKSPDDLKNANFDDVETNSLFVNELICMGDCAQFGGKNTADALSLTINGANSEGGDAISGGVEKILFYRSGDDVSLTIERAGLQIGENFNIFASINYEQSDGEFLLRAAATGAFEIGDTAIKAAVAGKFANIGGQTSFGLFVAFEAGPGIPIVPGVVTLRGAGGGFFYRPDDQDFDMVFGAIAAFGHELVDAEQARPVNAKFAAMLFANIDIGSAGGGAAVVNGTSYFQITSQSFYIDARVTVLGMDGDGLAGTTAQGTLMGSIAKREDGEFAMQIGITVDIRVPNILQGEGSITFFMNNLSRDLVWGIVGTTNLNVFGNVLTGTSVFAAGNPGFMLQVDVGFNINIAIMKIESRVGGAIWVITDERYQFPFGAYVTFDVEAKILGGLVTISAGAQAAFVTKRPSGFELFATVYGCLGAGNNAQCGSAWASYGSPGGLKFGFGRGAHGDLVAQAQAQLEQFQAHIISLMEGIDGALALMDLDIPLSELAPTAEEAERAGYEYFKLSNAMRILYDDAIHNSGTMGRLPVPLQNLRNEVLRKTRPYWITPTGDVHRNSAEQLAVIFEAMQETVNQDLITALELQEAAEASYQSVLESMSESPLRNVLIPVATAEASQGVHFEVDLQLADNQVTGTETYRDELENLDQEIRQQIFSVLNSLSEMDGLLQENIDGNSYTLLDLAHAYGDMYMEMDRYFARFADRAFNDHAWAIDRLAYINANSSEISNAIQQLSTDHRILLLQATTPGANQQFIDEANLYGGEFVNRQHLIELLKREEEQNHAANIGQLNTFNKAGSGIPDVVQYFETFISPFPPDLSNQLNAINIVNQRFWWDMTRGGLIAFRNQRRDIVEQVITADHSEYRATMLQPLKNITEVLDDFYAIRANITAISYNMINNYLEFRYDEEKFVEDDGKYQFRIGSEVFTEFAPARSFLANQLMPPQISDIIVYPNRPPKNNGETFYNETEVVWTASHSDRVIESAINITYPGQFNSDTDISSGPSEFMSIGDRDRFTFYPYRRSSAHFEDLNVGVRVRGSAGNTAIRRASFRVDVGPFGSGNSVNPGQSVVPPVDQLTAPAPPAIHLGNHYSFAKGNENQNAFWTSEQGALTLEISAYDAQVGIGQWEYAIGSQPGLTDVRSWSVLQGQVQFNPNIPAQRIIAPTSFMEMEPGAPYYISARVRNTMELQSGVTTAEMPLIYDPVPLNAITQDRVLTSIQQPGTDVTEVNGPIATLPPYEKILAIRQSWTATSPQRLHFRHIEAFPEDSRAEIPDGESSISFSGLSHFEYVLSGEESIQPHQFEQLAESFTGDELIIHNPDFEIGEDIYWHVRAVDNAGNKGSVNSFGPYQLIDYTLPETGIMRAKPYTDKIRVFVTEPPFDPESDLAGIQYAIGTDPKGGSYIRPFPAGNNVDLQWNYQRSINLYNSNNNYNRFFEITLQEIEALDIKDEFYIFYRSVNTQGMTSEIAATGPLMIDTTPPLPPTVTVTYQPHVASQDVPLNTFRIFVSNITDPESGVLKVEYWVERRPNSNEPWPDFSPQHTNFSNLNMHTVLADYDEPRHGTFAVNVSITPPFSVLYQNAERRVRVRITNGSGLITVHTVYPSNSPFYELFGSF